MKFLNQINILLVLNIIGLTFGVRILQFKQKREYGGVKIKDIEVTKLSSNLSFCVDFNLKLVHTVSRLLIHQALKIYKFKSQNLLTGFIPSLRVFGI